MFTNIFLIAILSSGTVGIACWLHGYWCGRFEVNERNQIRDVHDRVWGLPL